MSLIGVDAHQLQGQASLKTAILLECILKVLVNMHCKDMDEHEKEAYADQIEKVRADAYTSLLDLAQLKNKE